MHRGPSGRAPGRMPAAAVGALACAVILLGACTISSESPDATSLGGRSGPSSGTTTTAGTAGAGEGSAGDQGDRSQPTDATAGGGESAPAESDGSEEVPASAAPPEPESPDAPGTGTQGAADVPDTAGAAQTTTVTAPEPGVDATDSGGSGAADPADGTGEDAPQTAAAPEGAATDPGSFTGGAFDQRSRVSTVGIGSVYFGMSPEEAAERAGTEWDGVPTGGADCYVVTPNNGPPGVALWVYHGTVERVDIDTPLLRTQSGLGVGTHLGELQSRLGDKLVVEDHPLLAGWTLATFVPTDPNDAAFRIAFDISGGEVIRFRTGRTELVALESCA